MEHIVQFDWCNSVPERHFLLEEDIDNCATEKILRNKFYDPLLSESEDEGIKKINWNEIFKKKKETDRKHQIYIPGLRALPPYPKLSSLTSQQHYQCLKVLCAQNPHILELEFIPRPTKGDHRVFEEVKQVYEAEQKEYIEWAKTLWTNGLCVRALRPKPTIETVYNAEFKMKEHTLKLFPRKYSMAAQICMESRDKKIELKHEKDYIKINITELPRIKRPEMCRNRINILKSCTIPEPCTKHPCRFVLPSESSMSILPLTEVNRELAQWAADREALFVCSESGLRALVQLGRLWTVPVSVISCTMSDGDTRSVVVVGNEFSPHKESAPRRTYRAFRHLLENALVPSSEKEKLLNNNTKSNNENDDHQNPNENDNYNKMDVSSSDEEEDNLFIDEDIDNVTEGEEQDTNADINIQTETDASSGEDKQETSKSSKEYYECTCKETIFERPRPRSYRHWSLKSCSSLLRHDVIVHCAHKLREESEEVILEPIPEYLIDMGGSRHSEDSLRAAALSLALRQNASLLTARVDAVSGDLITLEKMDLEQINKNDVLQQSLATIHATLDQLQGLRPGHYLLQHQASHGANALLLAPCLSLPSLELGSSATPSQPALGVAELDEACAVADAPTLAPVLLPIHKFHKSLPCAFTANPHLVQRPQPPRRPPARGTTPPQAIKLRGEERNGSQRKWPKRKGRGKKKNNHSN